MKDPAITIVRLTPAHSGAMSALHRTGFAAGWSQEAIDALLDGPHCLGLGAFGSLDKDGAQPEILGFLLLNIVADEAEILTLVVTPSVRRRGIAAALLKQAIVSAKASGAASFFLEVSTGNAAAVALYATFGFEETGRRPGYYKSENGADAIVMLLRL